MSLQGDWVQHGTSWYNCNRFDDKEASKDPQSASRVSLERYLHVSAVAFFYFYRGAHNTLLLVLQPLRQP